MQAIIDVCKSGILKSKPAVVISNNNDSGAISRAKKEGIPYFHLSDRTHPVEEDLDQAILDSMISHDTDIVILAGYMKKLGLKTLNHFKGAILNIHPALLPKYPGVEAIQRAFEAGDKKVGVTVHFVDEGVDTGPIILQEPIDVRPDDTLETLTERVHKVEHRLFPEAIRKVIGATA